MTSRRHGFAQLWAPLLACALLGQAGCGFGQSGIEPPRDRLFFPAGILVDPSSEWLYVVNSNSDLRFNAGTVAALNLNKVARDRDPAQTTWGACPSNRFSRNQPVMEKACCRDLLDGRILNCDERSYIAADATVRIGSFGGAITQQVYQKGADKIRRLFVAVRADPSVTFIDATVQGPSVSMRCSGPREGPPQTNALCDDNWRVRQAGMDPDPLRLPEEPYALALDDALGILYVGHLFGGVSSIDVCSPLRLETPRLSAVTPTVFRGSRLQGVTSLLLAAPGNPAAPLLATSRFSTEVTELALRSPASGGCTPTDTPPPIRDLTVVPTVDFPSAAFYPNGADVRGVLLSPDGQRAFVLHRNDPYNRRNPAALVVIDLHRDANQAPVARPVDVLEVCPGPTEMRMHDAGRGPKIFVTCFEAGQIYVIDPDLLSVTAIIDAGRGPNTTVFPPADRTMAYVATFTDNTISVLDLKPGSATEYRVVQRIGFPHLATQ